MTASTYPVNTPERAGAVSVYPVAAATQINVGSLVALNSTGFIVPASNTVGLMVLGRAEEDGYNLEGGDGDISIQVKRGVFRYDASVTNVPTQASIGDLLFVEDDQTVGTDGSARVVAGRLLSIDSFGCWIDTTVSQMVPSADTLTALTFSNFPTGAEISALNSSLIAILKGKSLII